MSFTVQDFRTALQYSGARANQFEVILAIPFGSSSTTNTRLSFTAHASSIPGEDLGIIRVSYFGRQITLAGDRTFPEWQITVYNDEPWDVRSAFEQWSGALNGHYYNLRSPAAQLVDQYQVDATVIQYGKTGNVIAEYDMVGCWPASVSPIELSWDGNDQIETFQVTFAYQWWLNSNTDFAGTIVGGTANNSGSA